MFLKQGFLAAMHDGRTDFCMVLGLIAIALFGSGAFPCRRRGAQSEVNSLALHAERVAIL